MLLIIGTNEVLCTEYFLQTAKLMEHVAPAIVRMGTLMENMGDLWSSNTGQDQNTGMYLMAEESDGTMLANMIEFYVFIPQLLPCYWMDIQ